VLNGPTNEAWLTPWHQHLLSSGVKYQRGTTVTALKVDAGKVAGVEFRRDGSAQTEVARADHYVLAVPVERAATLVSKDLLALDPTLANIIKLAPNVEWMNGIQFFLNTELKMHLGHTIYAGQQLGADQHFAEAVLVQLRAQGPRQGRCAVGVVGGHFGLESPGDFNQKAAQDCTPR